MPKLYLILTISIIFLSWTSCKNTTKSLEQKDNDIMISLAQWSFHKALMEGKMTHLQFITKAGELGFGGVEYVNTFFKDKAADTAFLDEMKSTAEKAGVRQLLIMIDNEGHLAETDVDKRNEAVLNHYKWVDAAAYLGCHSIRVNAHGEGSPEVVMDAAVDGLSRLAEYASTRSVNVIVENHGGYSSNGKWLAEVIEKVNRPNCGTLPDFGNFCLKREEGAMWGTPCLEWYDKYEGVKEMMPYAKAVSAKSYDFDEKGEETTIDYKRMLDIVKNSGYKGFVGVEYEGDKLGEEEGIKATKILLEKYR
ncbi:MAG: sugar phosphate isomerase/epimerase [Saprospiraceae bacterium]|nr:sugar phosphate isomerase/epimerase [Saprospiraceae bacterium]